MSIQQNNFLEIAPRFKNALENLIFTNDSFREEDNNNGIVELDDYDDNFYEPTKVSFIVSNINFSNEDTITFDIYAQILECEVFDIDETISFVEDQCLHEIIEDLKEELIIEYGNLNFHMREITYQFPEDFQLPNEDY